MSEVNVGFQIPLSVQEILEACPKYTVASTWQELYELATRDAVNGVHEVAYEVPGRRFGRGLRGPAADCGAGGG